MSLASTDINSLLRPDENGEGDSAGDEGAGDAFGRPLSLAVCVRALQQVPPSGYGEVLGG